MGTEHCKTSIENESSARTSAPPGFASLSSFLLKKVEHCEENLGFKASNGASTLQKLQGEAKSDRIDMEKLKESVGNRPWILYGKSHQIPKENPATKPDKVIFMPSSFSFSLLGIICFVICMIDYSLRIYLIYLQASFSHNFVYPDYFSKI